MTEPAKATSAKPAPIPWAGLKNLRKTWLSLHLYIALATGFFFAILGLTGSCNVFYFELRELGLPAVQAEPGKPPLGLDEIMRTVRAIHPQKHGQWNLVLPGERGDYLWVRYPKPEETADELYAPLEILVNPFTGETASENYWGRTLWSLVYELHATFLTGKLGPGIGRAGFNAVCFLGLFLFVSVLSGICLWWPRPGKFIKAVTFKRGASPQRFYYDLHKTAGFYGSAILLALAFSGFSFAYKDYLTPLVNRFSPVADKHLQNPELKSTAAGGAQPISIAQAVAIADRVFPDGQLRALATPDGPEGVFMVAKRQPGEANRREPRSKVWIDQYSGKLLAVQDPNRFTAGETFLNLLWPLHNGEAFGLAGRVLWSATGFVPLVLYVSGLIRWSQKREAKSKP